MLAKVFATIIFCKYKKIGWYNCVVIRISFYVSKQDAGKFATDLQ